MTTSGETRAADTWLAWRQCDEEFGGTHRVYGVAMHAAGDTIFQSSIKGGIEVVIGSGLLLRPAGRSDVGLLDQCIASGNFMVCVHPRGHGEGPPILRVYPGQQDGWSVKSLHPSRGGLGRISATVIR